MGKNLAPVPKPTFYGQPPVPQLVFSGRTPAGAHLSEKWFRPTGNSVPLSNTMYSLAPRNYYHDAASCAIDAVNLALGRVCTPHTSILDEVCLSYMLEIHIEI